MTIRRDFGSTSKPFSANPNQTHFNPLKLLFLFRLMNPVNSFLKLSNFLQSQRLSFISKNISAEQKTHFSINQDEPMQTDPIYWSSDEDTEIQYHMSDWDQTNDHDDCWLNQSWNSRTNPQRQLRSQSQLLTYICLQKRSQQLPTPNRTKTSTVCLRYLRISFPNQNPIQLNVKSSQKKRFLHSPTTPNTGPTQFFKPYDLPNTPPSAKFLNNAKLTQSPRNWNI